MARNFYEILGVEPGDDAATIKTAYRCLVLKYHPDQNDGDPHAAAQLQAIREAYEVLSDEARRRRYDRKLLQSPFDRIKTGHPTLDAVINHPETHQAVRDVAGTFLEFFGDRLNISQD